MPIYETLTITGEESHDSRFKMVSRDFMGNDAKYPNVPKQHSKEIARFSHSIVFSIVFDW